MATKTHKHQLTDEQRAERRQLERQRMAAAVEELRSSDGWQRWLTTRSRFHRYSFGNQLLIASQNPDATRVAGFRKWLELGYCVRKGQHALYIWAPCPPSKKQLEEARENGEDAPQTFFKMTAVFGQDQVDELPPPSVPQPIAPPITQVQGDELAPVWGPLVKLGADIGSEVSRDWTGQAGGYYEPATKRIVIDETASANGQVKTLIHELAHALVRADHRSGDPTLTYAQEELVVESIACSVTGTLGLDTSGYSVPYLTTWSTNTALEILEQTAKLINRLASRIEDAIPEEVTA